MTHTKKMYTIGKCDQDILTGRVLAAFTNLDEAEAALRGQLDSKDLMIVEIKVSLVKKK